MIVQGVSYTQDAVGCLGTAVQVEEALKICDAIEEYDMYWTSTKNKQPKEES